MDRRDTGQKAPAVSNVIKIIVFIRNWLKFGKWINGQINPSVVSILSVEDSKCLEDIW